jgi:hypothetical protein
MAEQITQTTGQHLEAVAQGQGELAGLMQQLIQLVQAERERVPERGPDGSIARVIDRIKQ